MISRKSISITNDGITDHKKAPDLTDSIGIANKFDEYRIPSRDPIGHHKWTWVQMIFLKSSLQWKIDLQLIQDSRNDS